MKKMTAVLMALALMCSFFCAAEEMSIEQQAKDVISMVNYFVKENTGYEQLFVGYQEVAAGQIYGFSSEDNALQALLVANTDDQTIDSCSFICDAPVVMPLALNCATVLPFAQLLNESDASIAEELQADMLALADWFDENRLDAMEAFENNTLYGISYVESEFFHLELMIVPLDEGARMMATYYFRPFVAEEAAE